MAENLITAEGLADLNAKLAEMEGHGRQEIADRILVARGFGDLSENAEYHAAKNDQAHHETAVLKLRARIQEAVVVTEAPSDGTVGFGSTVTFLDQTSGKEQTFTLVASHEAKPADGKLSAESPMAQALMRASKGDSVRVALPAGERKLTVVSVA
ncbi:MAG: transcription elongation factor GreA [Solirubrobacterales bacterium]|nr:transcription elongation factor GreA [Solirubrobacterales bacterium]